MKNGQMVLKASKRRPKIWNAAELPKAMMDSLSYYYNWVRQFHHFKNEHANFNGVFVTFCIHRTKT